MGLTAATRGFFVFLLSVSVVLGQTGYGVTYSSTQICAVGGSTVEIQSSFTYPYKVGDRYTTVEKKVWFTGSEIRGSEPYDLSTDSKFSGRVTHSCIWKKCTLRISDLRESDSAEYKFRFITNQEGGSFTGSPGVTLTVSVLHVEVKTSSGSSWAEVKCQSRCRLSARSYVWYKNGVNMNKDTYSVQQSFDWGDSVSCAVKGSEKFPSPPQCVLHQTCNKVTYTDRSICAIKGSSVDISSTYSHYYYVESKFWFSPDRSRQWMNPSQPEDLSKDSQYSGRVQVLEPETGRSTLRITNLRESDSSEYHFKFKTQRFEWRSVLPGTTLTVTDIQDIQVKKRANEQKLDCIVTFNSCRPFDLSYLWYKNGIQEIRETSGSYAVSYNYGDSYSCALKGYEEFHSPLTCFNGETCYKVTYTDRSICAIKGSSVDISSTYSHYDYYYDVVESKFWFSRDRSHQWMNPSQPEDLSKDSQYSGRVQVLEPETGTSTLRITNLTESDSSEYHFKFETPWFEWRSVLPGTTLTVTALQVQVTRIISVHQSQTEAELKCLSSCSPAGRLYVWFKNQQKIRTQQTSTLTDNFSPGDTISCAFSGHEDYRSPSVYTPKLPSVSMSPSGEIVEGISVTLTCSSDANPAANYTWYKNQTLVSNGPQLVLSSIQPSVSGEYQCTAENAMGKMSSRYITIDVKYPPKLPSVSVSPSGEIVEGSLVTLTCSSDANPAANYTWYKENQTLSQGSDGVHAFISISSNNRGNYYCKSENQYGYSKSSSLFIDVQYPPKLPHVSVSPSGEIVEGSSVTLTCNSDANPAATYTWYKENQTLILGPEGIYRFPSVSSEDRGIYYCKSENQYGWTNPTPLFLDVKYPPKLPSVSVSPSGEIVEGSSGTLTCSSDANPAANYTWYKENEDSPKASGQILNITDIGPEHRGSYYCEAHNRIGRRNSTLHLVVVASAWKTGAIATVTAALLVVPVLGVFLWKRRNECYKLQCKSGERPVNTSQTDMGPVYDTPSSAAEIQPTEQQDDVHYSTINFSQGQIDVLYSNIRQDQPRRQTEEEDEDTEYTAVKCVGSGIPPGPRRQENAEDSFALYSIVNKNYTNTT
ncbi:uncharacterized protein LOC125001639 [Mugil cephalus]|uniref:uncharacterized protein LOC125001639 n=1 Tax=Mugil cephalus TaxID=48193 RepID=UPI001FB5A795|nr:uncharacterized protein LOC125001639 [Mugil cephalus]